MKLVTAFEKAINETSPLPEEYLKEGWEIFCNDSYEEFLFFLYVNHCFTPFTYKVFQVDSYLYDEDDENYYECDYDKQEQLLNKVFSGRQHELDEQYQKES